MRHVTLAFVLVSTGCATTPATSPQEAFFQRLSSLCGKAFEGRVASPAMAADADFAGKRLVMHVRECSAGTIRIPFHVGDDRSRTWVVTRNGAGLRLKHDHRHPDGSEDALTQYGGDSAGDGTATRQLFPADRFSKDMFIRQGRAVSISNIWAMEVHPGRAFAYELRRPGRFFRVEFHLTKPVPAPPPPWGGG
ncbi:MAG TPA: hypothetical protein VGC35_05445 [Allosphingosinicella sp.]|jgi:hypothetical protein